MNTRLSFALALVSAALLSAGSAQARSPCDVGRLVEGPVQVGFSQGDFGIVRSACPRSELGLGIGGRAIIDGDNFYGNLRGGTRLDVGILASAGLMLSASIEPFVFHQVIQSFKATHLGLGESSVGATLLAVARERFALSVTTRLTLPTAIGLHVNSWPIGVEAGVLALLQPIDQLRLHGGFLGGLRTAVSKAAVPASGAVIGNAGVDVVINDEWLAFVVDVNGQALERGGLDLLAVSCAARTVLFDQVGLEVGASIPIAGDERHLASAIVRASYRFE